MEATERSNSAAAAERKARFIDRKVVLLRRLAHCIGCEILHVSISCGTVEELEREFKDMRKADWQVHGLWHGTKEALVR